VTAGETGIYKADDTDISVNLMNPDESDLNKGIQSSEIITPGEAEKVKQDFSMTPFLILSVLLLSFLDIYVQKKRGEI